MCTLSSMMSLLIDVVRIFLFSKILILVFVKPVSNLNSEIVYFKLLIIQKFLGDSVYFPLIFSSYSKEKIMVL